RGHQGPAGIAGPPQGDRNPHRGAGAAHRQREYQEAPDEHVPLRPRLRLHRQEALGPQRTDLGETSRGREDLHHSARVPGGQLSRPGSLSSPIVMETIKVPLNEDIKNCPPLQARVKLRLMSAEEFIEKHASGTLRKNKSLGMVWKQQYLAERCAYEFGWGFEC